MRKLTLSLFAAGLLVGAALGQSPGPAPAPTPAPVPAPIPTPVVPPVPAPQPIQISGSSNVPCYGYGRFDLTGTYTSAGWLCFPDRTTGASVVRTDTFNGGTTFIVAGSPGTYDLGAFAATPTGMQTVQTTFTILPPVLPPSPAPTPTPVNPPTPTPTPAPSPLGGKFWAIAVYDTSQPLPASYSDGTIGTQVSGMGGVWLKYGIADAAVASTNWMAAAKKQGAPALVIVASDGSVYGAAALPSDVPSIVTVIKGALGHR